MDDVREFRGVGIHGATRIFEMEHGLSAGSFFDFHFPVSDELQQLADVLPFHLDGTNRFQLPTIQIPDRYTRLCVPVKT